MNVVEDDVEMPNHDLTKRPSIAKIKHATGTTMYTDHTIKNDPDARGIRLAVGATTKTWLLGKRINGKQRTITLGSWPELPTVFKARDIAKEKMASITSGTDEQSTGIRTLHDALESHIRKSDASQTTHGYYRAQVDRHMARLFAMPLEDVTLENLEDALRPHNVGTQKHLAQIIRTSFKRASVVRRCFNVADGLKVQTKRYQPDNVVKFDADATWPALDLINTKRDQNPIIAAAFELMLLTGLRAGNVIALRWSDVDLDAGKLRVAELKNGRAGVFPLADRVIALLDALPKHSEWVFPQHDATKHIYHPERLSDGVNILRPHDCRRLFTTAARRLELPAYIIDQLRGDVEKGVQGIYDQGSASRRHANAITQQIEVECGSLPASTIVQLRASR